MSLKSNYKLRDATVTDAPAVLDIYRPFISTSITSLEFEVPTEEEIRRRIKNTLLNFPWLVCEAEDGSVAGYAYGSKHRDREGYQWIAETGIYTSPDHRGKGIGSLLYEKLCEILAKQGYFQALAIISGNNLGSIEFHKKCGFKYVGEYKNCGNKFGKWCDVSWYSKQLNKLKDDPEKPIPYSLIKHSIVLN